MRVKVIREHSNFRIGWDLLILILILISCGLIPFQIAFRLAAYSLGTEIIYFYGDITPHRNIEYVFTVVVMLIGALTYAFIIGNIASLFSNLDAARAGFFNKIDAINQYLRSRQVPQNLNEQVRNYYEYLWAQHRGVKEDMLFDDLPVQFRLDILRNLTRDLLDSVLLFQHCSPALRNVLLSALKPQTYAPDVYIARQGELGKEIYFLSRGKTEITSDNGKKTRNKQWTIQKSLKS